MVLRRSLRLTEAAYPWLVELRRVGPDDDLTAALAIVATLLDLFVTLIGARLIMQLLEETWPDVFPPST